MRDLFLLDPGVIFLNHGSFGACPAEVLAVQHDWQRQMERNPVEFLGRRSAALLFEARSRLAAYVGAQPDDLIFVTNATTAVNVVARSLDLRPGDEILTTDHEYGACDAAWEQVCRQTGASYRHVPIPLPFRREQFTNRILSVVTPQTRAIYLSHVTSTTALIFPIEELCRSARERGLLTIIDGAHGPGHVPLDLQAIGADYYTGNCHKWLGAPKGAAFLHVRPEHHAQLRPLVVSWGACAEISGYAGFDAYTGTTALERRLLWQGTRDLSPFLTVPAAIDFQERHDWDAERQRCHELAVETRKRIDALTGQPAICDDGDIGQMVAIALPPCDAEMVRTALFDRYRIEVPLTAHAGKQFVRAAFQAYNTREDADALIAALSELFDLKTR